MTSFRRVNLIPLLVFVAGVINILSSLWAEAAVRIALLENYIPLRISNLSRTITVEIGIILIFLSFGLWQRKRRAWLLSLIAIIPVLATHMIKGLDIEEALVNLFVLGVLIRYRRYFSVESKTLTVQAVMATLILGIAALGLYVYAGFYALRGEFRVPVTFSSARREYTFLTTGYGGEQLVPATRRARWFYDSVVYTHTLALILVFPALFAPVVKREYDSEKDRDTAVSLMTRTGHNSVTPMAGMPDKLYYFNPDRTCCVAYRISGKFAVVLGDPIGYEEERADMIGIFEDYCFSCGLKPVWYNVDGSMLLEYQDHHNLLIGEEAVIDLARFSLIGPLMKDVRNAVTKLAKDNLSFVWRNFADIPWKELKQIEAIHVSWLKNKKMSPMTFSLEYFPLPTDQQGLVLEGIKNGKIVTVLSFFPYQRAKAYVLDLMLRTADAPNGIMETAIVRAAEYFREKGSSELNLSLAPLVVSEKKGEEASARNEFLERFERWYKFRPLRSFKDKFNPVWRPKYLVYKSNVDLPGAAIALVRVHLAKHTKS